MDLYVVRHGIAAGSGISDVPLTDEGRVLFARSVRGLGRLDVLLDGVLNSPLQRALQTAELLAPLLDGERRTIAHLATAPSAELLAEFSGRSLALVGHEPWQSELIAWLVTGERDHSWHFAMEKGAVAFLRGAPSAGAMGLMGFWRPDVLQALGGR